MKEKLVKEFVFPCQTLGNQKVFGMQARPHIGTVDLAFSPSFVGVMGPCYLHDKLHINLNGKSTSNQQWYQRLKWSNMTLPGLILNLHLETPKRKGVIIGGYQ